MFVDLDWPLNASSLLSASAELLVAITIRYDYCAYLTMKSATSLNCVAYTTVWSASKCSFVKTCIVALIFIVIQCWFWLILMPTHSLFRLDALAKALSVIATATWVAGWVAGWVSVTLRYCIKTAKRIRKLFRPSESPIILVLWDPCADTKFQGEPHQRGR